MKTIIENKMSMINRFLELINFFQPIEAINEHQQLKGHIMATIGVIRTFEFRFYGTGTLNVVSILG